MLDTRAGGCSAVVGRRRWIAIAADASEVWPSWAALGVAFEFVAAHLLRFRGAHILCLCLVPYYAGMVMTTAWVWALAGALGAGGCSRSRARWGG